MEPTTAVLIAAGLATTGWIYAARKARTLARKQHTINVLLQASFNKEFLEARNALAPHLKSCVFPEDVAKGENEVLRAQFRSILNHYCAALREAQQHQVAAHKFKLRHYHPVGFIRWGE